MECFFFGIKCRKNASFMCKKIHEPTGKRCGYALIRLLQSCDPLPEADIMAQHGVRSTEAASVNKHFPTTSANFDRTPHVCKGSENLAPLLLRQLQSRGYLIACCDSDGSL